MLLQRSVGWFALMNWIKEREERTDTPHWEEAPNDSCLMLVQVGLCFNLLYTFICFVRKYQEASISEKTKILYQLHALLIPLLFLLGNKLVTFPVGKRKDISL